MQNTIINVDMKKSSIDPARKPLTKKQIIFIEEYSKTQNGTQAALKAYDTKDAKAASVIAAENLGKLSIQNEIRHIAQKTGLTLEKSVHRLHSWIDSEVGELSLRGLSLFYDVIGAKQFKIDHEHHVTNDDAILKRYAPQVDTIDVTEDDS